MVILVVPATTLVRYEYTSPCNTVDYFVDDDDCSIVFSVNAYALSTHSCTILMVMVFVCVRIILW